MYIFSFIVLLNVKTMLSALMGVALFCWDALASSEESKGPRRLLLRNKPGVPLIHHLGELVRDEHINIDKTI
jgi:hypothetical protein